MKYIGVSQLVFIIGDIPAVYLLILLSAGLFYRSD